MSQSIEADVDHRHAVGQRLDLAPHRHAHRIGAQHDQQIEFGQHAAHLLLVAREPAHEAGVLGEEMRAVGDALLVDGGAQRLGERGGRLQRIALDDLVADDDDGPLGLQQPLGKAVEHGVGRARARVDPRRGAELDAGLGS